MFSSNTIGDSYYLFSLVIVAANAAAAAAAATVVYCVFGTFVASNNKG